MTDAKMAFFSRVPAPANAVRADERVRGSRSSTKQVRHRIVGSETYGGEEMLLLGDIWT
jgi:hypothetical protein